MKLSRYLSEFGITEAEFAEMIGSTQQSVNRYKNRVRIPLPKVMSTIHRVTNGQVSAADFYALDDAAEGLYGVGEVSSLR